MGGPLIAEAGEAAEEIACLLICGPSMAYKGDEEGMLCPRNTIFGLWLGEQFVVWRRLELQEE